MCHNLMITFFICCVAWFIVLAFFSSICQIVSIPGDSEVRLQSSPQAEVSIEVTHLAYA